MTESKNTYLPEQGEIDRTKIKGYSLRIGAFTSWVKENGYMTSVKAAMGSSDEIRKEILSLAKDLPKTGRLSYGSKDMEAYVGRVDKIVDMLIGYDGKARKANARFYRELERKERAIKNICGMPYALVRKSIGLEEIERDLPK